MVVGAPHQGRRWEWIPEERSHRGRVLGVGAPVVTEDEGQRLVMEGREVPGERRGLWQVHSAPGPPPSLPLDTNEGGRRLPEVQTYRILFLK